MNKNQYDMICFLMGIVAICGVTGLCFLIPYLFFPPALSNKTKVVALVSSALIVIAYLIGLYFWLGVTPPGRV